MVEKLKRNWNLLFHLCLSIIGLILFAYGFIKIPSYEGCNLPRDEDFWIRIAAFLIGGIVLLIEIDHFCH
jgi:hypothetical protein